MTALAELVVVGSVQQWRALGLDVAMDGVAIVDSVRLMFAPPDQEDPIGLLAWGLTAAPPHLPEEIDGIPTFECEPVLDPAKPEEHDLLIAGIDHLVVATSSLERTTEAITQATGEPCKRIRDAGGGVRQGFHRFGPVIIEVVESPQSASLEQAALWGLAFTVTDLDGVADMLGPELLSPPKDAVQPGRRISSFLPAAELGFPVALMSPEPPRP